MSLQHLSRQIAFSVFLAIFLFSACSRTYTEATVGCVLLFEGSSSKFFSSGKRNCLPIVWMCGFDCPEAFFLFSGFPSSRVSTTILVIKNTSSLHVIHQIFRYSLGHKSMLMHSSFGSRDMENTFYKGTWR